MIETVLIDKKTFDDLAVSIIEEIDDKLNSMPVAMVVCMAFANLSRKLFQKEDNDDTDD